MRAWRLFCRLGILGGAMAAAVHCGSDDTSTFDNGTNTAACTTAYAGKCGASCTGDTSCATGLYCNGSKVCTADCAPTVACTDGSSCSASGSCGGGNFGDGGTAVDGGTILPDGGFCADIDVTLAKTEPAVLFLLDQSSSMIKYQVGSNAESDNDCATKNDCRWTALKDALIGRSENAGLIYDLQHTALIAFATYSATDNKEGDSSYLGTSVKNPDQVCPRFNGKKFAGLTFSDDNYAAIDNDLRPRKVDDDTPTGEAVRAVVGLGADGRASDPKGFALANVGTSTKVLVLVTDGEAGYCVDETKSVSDADPTGTDRTILALQQTYKLNIPTYVIALGGPAQADDFKQIANAGQGKDPEKGNATAFAPQNTAALKTTLASIVTNARSCVFALNGEAVGDGSSGTVLVNGQLVPFGTQWRLATQSSIELLGEACTTVKSDPNATLKATFPCGSITIGPK